VQLQLRSLPDVRRYLKLFPTTKSMGKTTGKGEATGKGKDEDEDEGKGKGKGNKEEGEALLNEFDFSFQKKAKARGGYGNDFDFSFQKKAKARGGYGSDSDGAYTGYRRGRQPAAAASSTASDGSIEYAPRSRYSSADPGPAAVDLVPLRRSRRCGREVRQSMRMMEAIGGLEEEAKEEAKEEEEESKGKGKAEQEQQPRREGEGTPDDLGSVATGADGGSDESWVQCDECGKWRELPGLMPAWQGAFVCRMGFWEGALSSCEDAEAVWDPLEWAQEWEEAEVNWEWRTDGHHWIGTRTARLFDVNDDDDDDKGTNDGLGKKGDGSRRKKRRERKKLVYGTITKWVAEDKEGGGQALWHNVHDDGEHEDLEEYEVEEAIEMAVRGSTQLSKWKGNGRKGNGNKEKRRRRDAGEKKRKRSDSNSGYGRAHHVAVKAIEVDAGQQRRRVVASVLRRLVLKVSRQVEEEKQEEESQSRGSLCTGSLSGAAATLVAQAIAVNTNTSGGSGKFRALIGLALTHIRSSSSGSSSSSNSSGSSSSSSTKQEHTQERITEAMSVFQANSAGETKHMLEALLPVELRKGRQWMAPRGGESAVAACLNELVVRVCMGSLSLAQPLSADSPFLTPTANSALDGKWRQSPPRARVLPAWLVGAVSKSSFGRCPVAPAKRNNDPALGWHREVRRRVGDPKKADVYFYPPVDEADIQLRSRPEIARYLAARQSHRAAGAAVGVGAGARSTASAVPMDARAGAGAGTGTGNGGRQDLDASAFKWKK